jgi:hypothetical protein
VLDRFEIMMEERCNKCVLSIKLKRAELVIWVAPDVQ